MHMHVNKLRDSMAIIYSYEQRVTKILLIAVSRQVHSPLTSLHLLLLIQWSESACMGSDSCSSAVSSVLVYLGSPLWHLTSECCSQIIVYRSHTKLRDEINCLAVVSNWADMHGTPGVHTAHVLHGVYHYLFPLIYILNFFNISNGW